MLSYSFWFIQLQGDDAMAQNIYDNPDFFAGYAQLARSQYGLAGAPEWKAVRALLPDLQGKQVVDLGCGYGWFSRWARDAGAASVLGLDISAKMLARAAELTNGSGITWQRADLDTLSLPPRHYDLIYSALVFHYLQDLPRLFATLFAALKPGGELVFTAEHPVFTAPRQQQWLMHNGEAVWPVEGYQREGERVSDWLAKGVVKQHRKLATYLNALVTAGFQLRHLDEWGPSDRQVAEDSALAIERERPMFFIVRVEKPQAA